MFKKNFQFAESVERQNPNNEGLIYHKKRYNFLVEEVEETKVALENNDLVEYIDGRADVTVIATNNIYHALRGKGLKDWEAAKATIDFLQEVFESNLSKLVEGKAIFDKNNKVQKPETFFKPNIKLMLEYLNIPDCEQTVG